MLIIYSDVPRRHSRKVHNRDVWYKLVREDELEAHLADNWRQGVVPTVKADKEPENAPKKAKKTTKKVK